MPIDPEVEAAKERGWREAADLDAALAEAALVASWGFQVTGRTSRPHRHPAVAYRAFRVDAR